MTGILIDSLAPCIGVKQLTSRRYTSPGLDQYQHQWLPRSWAFIARRYCTLSFFCRSSLTNTMNPVAFSALKESRFVSYKLSYFAYRSSLICIHEETSSNPSSNRYHALISCGFPLHIQTNSSIEPEPKREPG
jgi:hypothetical protein